VGGAGALARLLFTFVTRDTPEGWQSAPSARESRALGVTDPNP
jgi:hypothetical protein